MKAKNHSIGRAAVAVVAVALLMLTGSAAAYSFFDIETSQDNRFETGSIDLQVGWEESYNNNSIEDQPLTNNPGAIFNLTGIEPGDTGEATISFEGETNPYWMNFSVNQTAGPDPEPSYYQVDFVEGEVIHNLSEDNLYGDRKIAWKHGNVSESGYSVSGGEKGCVETDKMEFDHEEYQVTVDFEIDCNRTLTLASYEKASGGGWKPDEADEQVLVDYNTTNYTSGNYSLTIDLPEPDRGLGDQLEFLVWYDDGDNRYENERVIANGTAHEIGEKLEKGITLSPTASGISAFGTDIQHIGFRWRMNGKDVCEVQEQEKVFDFSFDIVQERNNPDQEVTGFHDTEISAENTFSTETFAECQDCGGIVDPSDGYYGSDRTFSNGDTGEGEYGAQIKSSSRVKFESLGHELGEEGENESDVFTITLENGNDSVWVKTKAGQLEESVKLEGEGDQKTVPSGAFTVELVDIIQNGDGTETYVIEVTSDDKTGGEGSFALSHVVFDFCEPIDVDQDNGEGEDEYYQIDLVEGHPIENLSDQLYHDRGSMIRHRHGNIDDGLTNPGGNPEQVECIESDKAFKLIQGGDTVRARFDVKDEGVCSDGVNVTLAVYSKPFAGWDGSRAGEQQLHDNMTHRLDPGKNHGLEVDLPGGGQ